MKLRTPIDIRHDYTPIQPIRQYGNKIMYLEVLPDLQLQPFILCYWELRACEPFSEDFHANIASDGCIDIFLELNNPTNNFIIGFCNKFTPFRLGRSFHYAGIRFSPAMFPYLFRVNASEFSNRIEDLHVIHPQLAQFIAQSVMPWKIYMNLHRFLIDIFLSIYQNSMLRLIKDCMKLCLKF